ncbi:MAG: patatin-like phospholipase family protein, partial [Rubrimonas sp.]
MIGVFAHMSGLAAMLAFVAATAAAGAPEPAPDEPRVGLVLAGGGAAGVAHVGVIRALEARGLRPDIVVGASMGAIVGGLYAAGYGPDDLEAVVEDVDWPSILNDLTDRSFVHPMRRDSRIDLQGVQTDLPLGVGAGGLAVAAGLVDGVRLSLILRQLAAPALGIEDFDDLPIPFRAVATDLATGRPVALEGGDLALALRASMSIPALFPPVRVQDRFLVDGGVSNNLPIDVARALGADRIIAVFIPPADVDPDSLGALSSSLSQTMSIFIHARSRELIETLGPDDILIVPDVGEVGMLDFALAPQTVAEGVRAVEAEAEAIDRLMRGRTPAAPREALADRADRPIEYDGLVVEYDGALAPEVIRRRLGLPDAGSATPQQIQDAVQRVQGLGLFQNVTYRLADGENGRDLVFRAERRQLGFAQLRFGLGLSTEFGDGGAYTIALGAAFTEL